MASDLTIDQERYVAPGETVNVAVNFEGLLRRELGEHLEGTPTVTSTPSLTLSNKAVLTVTTDVEDRAGRVRKVLPGHGLSFQATGFSVDVDYTVTVTCDTSEGQTRTRYLVIKCREE